MKMMNFLDKCLEKKDYFSVSHNTHKQKRLILSNLNELYANFKSKYVSTSIGFSKFCELQPKWCVIAGSSGTHSVCVCTYYQNMKLLLAPLNVTCHSLSNSCWHSANAEMKSKIIVSCWHFFDSFCHFKSSKLSK